MATAELHSPDVYPPLDASKFDIVHDVAVFDAHEDVEAERDEQGRIIRDSEGQARSKKIRYTRDVLESIAENLNRRIRDTGDYTAICLGHTPTPEERRAGAKPQPAVGFAGPYYVGEFGGDSRPVIYAKNWAIFKDDADLARKHPRRSVEVWAEPNLHDRIFDPIALLGAETPRRDLGILYSRVNTGRPVIRYSAVFASGGNTFVPGADVKERQQAPETKDHSMITDEDLQKIIAGVSNTAEMQFVRQMMEAEKAKGDPTPEAPATPEQFAEPEADDHLPADVLPEGTPKERNSEAEMDPEKEKELYRRREADRIRYSKIESDIKRVADENAQLRARVEASEVENRRVKRYSMVESLASEYLLDPAEELKRADTFDDTRWEEHVGLIKTRYARNPVGRPMLPSGEVSQPADKKADARNAKVREKIEHYSKNNIHKAYHEIEAEVDKELGTAA